MYDGPFCTGKYILYEKKQKTPKCRTQKEASVCLQIKKSCKTKAVRRGKCEQNCKRRFYTKRY